MLRSVGWGGVDSIFTPQVAGHETRQRCNRANALTCKPLTNTIIIQYVTEQCYPAQPYLLHTTIVSSYGLMMPAWRPTMNASRSST